MKEGWEYRRMDEVCSIARGGSPRPIKDYITNDPNGLNWIKIGDTDMGGKYIYSTKEKIKPEGLKKSRWVEEDEFLLSNSMSFGRPYILKTNGCIHDGWLVLRDYQKYLNIDFFYYVLSSENVQRQFRIKAQGSTVSNLNTDRVASVTIPIPPLSEQQSIVDYLDAAFAKIDAMKANAEKRLNEAKALFQASLKEMLEPKEGWEEKMFGDVCWYNKNNGIHKGTRYVGMEHIEQGTGSLLGTISSDDVLSNTFAFSKGDVLYGRLRPYLKKVIVADFDGCCSTEIFPIQSKEIVASFLMYWFLTDEITNKVNATCAGCRMPRGNMNDVLKFDISYPCIQEQQSIVATLDSLKSKVDRLQENYNKISQECDALKQAILRQVFE